MAWFLCAVTDPDEENKFNHQKVFHFGGNKNHTNIYDRQIPINTRFLFTF